MSVGKVIRTVQSEFAFLKEAKDAAYYHWRRLARTPHEGEFRALRFIPDSLAGSYLDIGANHGQSVESIRIFKPTVPIHCFEANGFLAEKLRNRYAGQAAIRVESFGLSDEPQSRPLYIPVYKGFVYDGLASFDKAFASAWLSDETLYGFVPNKLKLMEIPCVTKRLDDLELDPVFIKIVVQGFQYLVVKGGVETIGRCEPILMIQAFREQPDLVRLTESLGYQQYLFDDHGFYRADSKDVLNTILMTERRAAAVVRSGEVR